MIFNKNRTKSFMEKYDLHALIATSPPNVSYFSDLDCWMYRGFREYMHQPGAPNSLMQSYAIVNRDLDVDLVMRDDTAPFASDLKLTNIFPYSMIISAKSRGSAKKKKTRSSKGTKNSNPDSAGAALIKALRHYGITKGKVGIEFNNLSENSRRLLKKELPRLRFLDCTELMRMIRMAKTSDEVQRLSKAAEINESSILKVLQSAREGKLMGELILEYGAEVAKKGGIYDHFIYSPNGVGFTNVPGYKLSNGEHICVDFGCVYDGYYCDSGKSLIIGTPRTEWLEKYRSLWSSIDETKDLVKPGAKPSEILESLDRKLTGRGLPNIGAHGHGIGREPREYPVIMPTNYTEFHDGVIRSSVDVPIEKDMTINLESAWLVPGMGSMHVERTFFVGENGTSELWPQKEGLPMIVRF